LLQSSGEALGTLQTRVLPGAQQTLVRMDDLSAFANDRLAVIFTNTERATTRLEPLLQSGTDTLRALQTQVLPEAHRSLVRIEHLSTSLDDTVTKVKRNPAVLLRGTSPTPAGPGEAQ
jgi:phospholipid/cholesterol/gamma-HCH transport system substrate-binding protein